MTRSSVPIVVASVAAALGWVAVARTQPPARLPDLATSAPSTSPTGVAKAKVVGSVTCASASCHGAIVPHGTPGGESICFADADPHRNAYSVLFQERSKRMVRLLAEGKDHPPAHQTEVCLKCHGAAPPNGDWPAATSELHSAASCENCHGAAGEWLTDHYSRDWKSLDSQAKAAKGMLPTKDFAYRTKLCAGCHVGEPGREVDHRLIGAGHPALRFEITAYSTPPVYAKHWKTEKGYGPDAEAWLWAIGQVGTAKAAADLLNHRASEAEKQKHDWPEFAEYSCFSCHRGVIGEAPNPTRPGSKSGALPWGTWAYPQVLEFAGKTGTAWCSPSATPAGLLKLAKLYDTNDRPSAKDVKAASADASKELDAWVNELQYRATSRAAGQQLSPTELREALKVVLKAKPGFDWDASTQRFLGTAALYRGICTADPSARSPEAEAKLKALANRLQFPRGQDGPKIVPVPAETWDELRTLLNSGR